MPAPISFEARVRCSNPAVLRFSAALRPSLAPALICAIGVTQIGLLFDRAPRVVANLVIVLVAVAALLWLYPALGVATERLAAETATGQVAAEQPAAEAAAPTVSGDSGGFERGVQAGLFYYMPDHDEIGEGWLYVDRRLDEGDFGGLVAYRASRSPSLSYTRTASVVDDRLDLQDESLPGAALRSQAARHLRARRTAATLGEEVAALRHHFDLVEDSPRHLLWAVLLALAAVSLGALARLTTWGSLNGALIVLALRGLLRLIFLASQPATGELFGDLLPAMSLDWLPELFLAGVIVSLHVIGLLRPSFGNLAASTHVKHLPISLIVCVIVGLALGFGLCALAALLRVPAVAGGAGHTFGLDLGARLDALLHLPTAAVCDVGICDGATARSAAALRHADWRTILAHDPNRGRYCLCRPISSSRRWPRGDRTTGAARRR